MGIINPIQPNPVFETLPPPWQLALLDAWTTSVNAAVNSLYADPVAFASTINPPPSPIQVIPAGGITTTGVLFPNQIFQTGGTSFNPVTSLFTAPYTGVFQFSCGIQIVNALGGPLAINGGFSVNGVSPASSTGFYQFISANLPNAATASLFSGSVTLNLNMSDQIQVLLQTSGSQASISAGSGNQAVWFSGSAV